MYFIPKSARDVVTHPSPLSISAILGQKVNMLSYGSVQYASPFPTPKATSNMVMNKKVRTSVALAREGLLGKACQVLTSSGVVPSNNDTWELLQSKHPMGPRPTTRGITSPSAIIVPVHFNIMAILQSFPRSMICRLSGLRIQHLLEAAEILLQFPICQRYCKFATCLLLSPNI